MWLKCENFGWPQTLFLSVRHNHNELADELTYLNEGLCAALNPRWRLVK